MQVDPTGQEDRKSIRESRAQAFFEQDLSGQRQWYSARSSSYKSRAQILSLVVIGAGAATTFVQVFGEYWWTATP